MTTSKCKICVIIFLIFALSILATVKTNDCLAYPDAEVIGSSGANPPFDFSFTSTLSGFLLFEDTRLAVSYVETLNLLDMGRYDIEPTQPAALSAEDETDGVIGGIAYSGSRSEVVASQQDGDLVIFDLNDMTATPASISVSEDAELGAIAIDGDGRMAYVADNTNRAIQVVDLTERSLSETISLTITGFASFTITDAVYVQATDEIYFATDVGRVVYVSAGGSTASYILISSGKNLSALDAYPDGSYLYIVDATTPEVYRISTSSHSVVAQDIDISANPDPTDIVITSVSNPAGTYAYVAGSYGVSIIDGSDDEVFDMGSDPDVDHEPQSVSAVPSKLQASSSTDGYVYMAFTTAKMGILSANPWVTISSLTYADEAASLGIDGSFTVVFISDQDGTYEVRVNGSIDASGNLLTDADGNTSGSIAADTETSVLFNYNDNKDAFLEGDNDLWVFVTNDNDRGRRSYDLSVDTPPDTVTIRSTDFGNEKIYVTFDRLTASDIASYRFYVSTSLDEALTMVTPTKEVAHNSSGSTQTAEIGGLTNDMLYYAAMEGVDEGGNVSPSRSVTSETPAETVGIMGLLGEGGCGLMAGKGSMSFLHLIFILLPAVIIYSVSSASRFRRLLLLLLLIASAISIPHIALAQVQEETVLERDVPADGLPPKGSAQLWEFEIKTGFWMPSNKVLDQVFTKCCNMITRLEGGVLIHRRYGIGLGVGFLYKTAKAFGTGAHEGERSGERFGFLLIPMEANFTWRIDYSTTWRYLVPYVRGGVDWVYFREGLSGRSTGGIKAGLHGTGGVQLNFGEMFGSSQGMDDEFGINGFFMTLEAQYQWINNFGKKGLDLSGLVFSAGLLFEF